MVQPKTTVLDATTVGIYRLKEPNLSVSLNMVPMHLLALMAAEILYHVNKDVMHVTQNSVIATNVSQTLHILLMLQQPKDVHVQTDLRGILTENVSHRKLWTISVDTTHTMTPVPELVLLATPNVSHAMAELTVNVIHVKI
jgi:hypothetical protein